MESIETVIIGGGQAGLSLSYHLRQAGREHLVLEKGAYPAPVWSDQRWDSFTLVTPNWSFLLPGGEYRDQNPEGYMPRAEIAQRFEDYTRSNQLPVLYNHHVTAVDPAAQGGYTLEMTDGSSAQRALHARNVVVATGFYQRGLIPPFAASIPASITQLHSSAYRSPQKLPPGAVLVAGSSQSGGQIAEELFNAGRKVYLSTGVAPHAPRRYRGRDIYDWANCSGFLDRTAEKLPAPGARFAANPMITGSNGGHALNLHLFHRMGITLLGRAHAYEEGRLHFAPDLQANLNKADQGARSLLGLVDGYIQQAGIDAPAGDYLPPDDASNAPDLLTLDLRETGITSIVWACGLRPDFSLIHLPVIDEMGYPLAPRGVTRFPGLYFIGMPWLSRFKSGLLLGVAEDAAYIAGQIAR